MSPLGGGAGTALPVHGPGSAGGGSAEELCAPLLAAEVPTRPAGGGGPGEAGPPPQLPARDGGGALPTLPRHLQAGGALAAQGGRGRELDTLPVDVHCAAAQDGLTRTDQLKLKDKWREPYDCLGIK